MSFIARPCPAAEVYIGLTYGGAGDAPLIGVAAFTPLKASDADDAALSARLQTVLTNDLLWSRWFRIDEQGPPPVDEASLARWKEKNAAALVWGRASAAGDKVLLECRLYDLQGKNPIFEKRYETTAANWRALAHSAADEVVRRLTGRPGIARSKLAYVSDRSGSKEIHVADYDGEGQIQLTRDRSLCLLPRWGRDGRKIFYTTYRFGNPDIYQADLYERKPRPVMTRQGLNVPGAVSPDGATLLMTAAYAGRPANLYLLDLESKESRQVSFHNGVDSSGSFSPDGREIAFVSDRTGNPQVHVLTADTGRVRRLTDLNWCDSPVWQPSGEWIAFAGRPGVKDRMDIYLVDPTGTRLRQLTRDSGSNENPAWSPDGRFLAFTSTREGGRRLFVMDADGSAPRLLDTIPGNVYTPAWSP